MATLPAMQAASRHTDSTLAAAARPVRIGVTIGDAAGIGPEVVVAALAQTRLADRAQVGLYIAAELEAWLVQALARSGQRLGRVGGGPGLLLHPVPAGAAGPGPATPQPGAPSVATRAQAFRALDAMTDAAVRRDLDLLITGPVPKGIFDHLTPRPPGQTEFLATRLGAPRFAMMLAGPRLRVVPVTTHVPLRDVAGLLSVARIVDTGLAAADALVRWLDVPEPRLAVCGLNPHAGEEGRVGDEEARIIEPAVARLRDAGLHVEGPVVADSVFHHALAGRYDAVLCMYHDQALGPFKTVHFHDGSNLTCRLPVPRISPDHGTAYDIAGRGIADSASMVQTCLQAERIAVRTRATQEVQDA